ncbi:MAG: SBBP repeat-containing protein [Candidatus Thorarchaeota archaeon]
MTRILFLYALLSVGIMYAVSPVQYPSVSKHDVAPSNVFAVSDDLQLQFSTYIGGQGYDNVWGMDTDPQGNIYIVGSTLSEDFPTTAGAFDRSHNGGTDEWWPIDAFVMKLSGDGQEIIYSTFIGGSGDEYAVDIAVDQLGNAYVTGFTDSSDFPRANAYDNSHNGGSDAFVMKLSADGSELLFSTFFGGSGDDSASSIEIDGAGDCVIVGKTSSSDFPVATTNTQPSCHSLGYHKDAFIFKLSDNGSSLDYSMYLGGADHNDRAQSVDVDSLGEAVIVGHTLSADFPTVNALDETLNGTTECFITRLNTTGHIIFSTFYGGPDSDFADAVALDNAGQIYVTGHSYGGPFPHVGVDNPVLNGTWGLFLLILSPMGTDIIFSGVIKNSTDAAVGASNLVVVSEHEVWLGGSTENDDFPTTEDAFDRSFNERDGIITMIDPISCSLNYSSFFGGTRLDTIGGLAVTEQGEVIGAGTTTSLNLPVYNALDPNKTGVGAAEDGFVFRFGMNETVTSTTLTTSSTTTSTTTASTTTSTSVTTNTTTTTTETAFDFQLLQVAVISIGIVTIVIVVLRKSR